MLEKSYMRTKMMRIAICDIDDNFLQMLKRRVYRCANRYNVDLFIETFKSGEDLLKSESEFALIFIEYSLSGINGLETVKELRRRKNNVKVVFVSSYTQFVFGAFEVNAYRFFAKPLSETELCETLDDFFTTFYNNFGFICFFTP